MRIFAVAQTMRPHIKNMHGVDHWGVWTRGQCEQKMAGGFRELHQNPWSKSDERACSMSFRTSSMERGTSSLVSRIFDAASFAVIEQICYRFHSK